MVRSQSTSGSFGRRVRVLLRPAHPPWHGGVRWDDLRRGRRHSRRPGWCAPADSLRGPRRFGDHLVDGLVGLDRLVRGLGVVRLGPRNCGRGGRPEGDGSGQRSRNGAAAVKVADRVIARVTEGTMPPGNAREKVPAAKLEIIRKWGSWQDWLHDTAVITGPDRKYVLVALTKHPKGDEYLVDLAPMWKRVFTLGFFVRPWQTMKYVQHPEIGRFDADNFDHTGLGFIGGKILAPQPPLTLEQLKAIVKEHGYELLV